MSRRSPFKHHRFAPRIILLAVRRYCRYALSCRDMRDMLAERGVAADAATAHRWVVKFGPEISKRDFSHRGWRGQTWHVDETCIRVGGKWRYLWRQVNQYGKLIGFRLTARRDVNAARAFLRQAMDTARLYQPLAVITDKAHSYRKVLAEVNRHRDSGDQVHHILKRLNSRKGSMPSFKNARRILMTLQKTKGNKHAARYSHHRG